jgi:hypothetical protein
MVMATTDPTKSITVHGLLPGHPLHFSNQEFLRRLPVENEAGQKNEQDEHRGKRKDGVVRQSRGKSLSLVVLPFGECAADQNPEGFMGGMRFHLLSFPTVMPIWIPNQEIQFKLI